MKRIGLVLVAILLLAFPVFSQNVSIADTAFLYALIDEGVDTNEDSLISNTEAVAIISLDVSDNEISDLTGIEAFINLDTLACNNNSLTSLNVLANTAILDLSVNNNNLTNLDVSNNTLLEWLSFRGNELTSLNLTFNPTLIGLYIQDNSLTELDVSNNSALKYLRCRANQFSSLDVSYNTNLRALSIDEMPFLTCVKVWELPFPPEGVDLDTTDSPNVYFATECAVGFTGYRLKDFSIFPNPTHELLTIETDNIGLHSIKIVSMNGQLIYNTEMEGTTYQIDLSSFQKGIYFITIRSKDIVSTEKIIKL